MNRSGQLASIRGLLAAEGEYAPGKAEARWSVLLGCVVFGGLLYGACMGSWQVRPLQQLFSALKTPLLVSAGGLFCLPSFFVINNLLGLRDDLPQALRGVLASQATMAICLASLGPVVLVLYTGIDNYAMVTALNGVVFLLSSLGGHLVLSRHYRTLIERRPKHRIALFAWLATFWFVTIQLAWTLRPFIGSPGTPTTFFREDTWGNAYVEVWRVIVRVF